MNWRAYLPSFFEVMGRGYSLKSFMADLFAGFTVGIISLPLGMALAIGSGVEPVRGLFTSIIAGFLVAFLGGSRFQIAGPTGAFLVLIFDVVQRQGYEGLVLATLMASGFLILMGLCKVGAFLKFIPYPVLTGLTTGIAVGLFSVQVKDLFQLEIPHPSIHFLEKWRLYWEALPTTNEIALGLGVLCIIVMAVLRRLHPKFPGMVLVVLAASLLVWLFSIPVATVQTHYGIIPSTLPELMLPVWSIERVRELLPDAISIAVLAGVESLLTAAVADGMTGDRHRSNCELIAQGVANAGSALFGGIPATGAMARTVTNVRMGAKSSVSAMVYAMVVLVVLLFFSQAASQIPLTVLAAVLVTIAWHMADLPRCWALCKNSLGDALLLICTFLVTVFLDITAAVQVGVILAALLFMKRMAETTQLRFFRRLIKQEIDPQSPVRKHVERLPPHVEWLEIQGPLFFGASDLFNEFFSQADPKTRVVILSLAPVPMIDSTGVETLLQLVEQCHERKWELLLIDLNPQVRHDLMRSAIQPLLGEKRIFDRLNEALDYVSST